MEDDKKRSAITVDQLPNGYRWRLYLEREDGTFFTSPDTEDRYFVPRDTTFTRSEERRIREIVVEILRKAIDA